MAFVLVMSFACAPASDDSASAPPAAPADGARLSDAPTPAAVSETGPLVVFLGDSLTAGLGLGESQAFPARVAAQLAAEGTPIRVVNAGVSGDTSAGGLRRLDWLLRQQPDVLVVALGANDGLRGQDPEAMMANLRAIVTQARAAGARVLLTGMLMPPNYGADYVEGFSDVYPALARELDVALVPFLLDGVAGDPALNQADGIHPTAEGQARLAENVLPYLRPLLDADAAS